MSVERIENILNECVTVLRQRGEQYGDARRVHQAMGDLIGTQLQTDCSASDAALVMAQIKLARLSQGIDDPAVLKDTYIDAINYIAIAWGCERK